METKTYLKFDTTAESEKRYTIKADAFRLAVTSGAIRIYKVFKIEQRWIMKGDSYRGRIRKTTDLMPASKEATPVWEHTVKHRVTKGVDYEVTTEINEGDYVLLSKLYKDIPLQSKVRIYVVDQSGNYNKYTITADLPDDNPEICWIEFESNSSNVEKDGFKKPSWVQEYNG